jgi:hypothetical protein
MKIKTVLVAGLAGGIGYILGTRAGQGRYEEIKARADRLAHNPQVQETVTNLAEGVKKNAAKLPDPVADVVTKVADSVTNATDAKPGTGAGAGLADADLGTSSGSGTSFGTGSDLGAGDLGTAPTTTDLSDDLGPDLGGSDPTPRRAE